MKKIFLFLAFFSFLFPHLLLANSSFLKGLISPTKSNPDLGILHQVWASNLDPAYNSGNLPVSLQSPLVYEGMLFVGLPEKGMGAFNLDNGKMIWFQKSEGTFHSKGAIYKDHLVYGNTEGRVFSRHYLTGDLKYEVDLGDAIESEAVIAKDRVLFQLRNHQVFCLDVQTGKILWGHKRSVPFLTTLQKASAPLVEGNKVIVGHADGNLVAYALEDGSLVWEQKLSLASKFMDVDMNPILWDKKILAGPQGGALYMIDPNTGSILGQFETQLSRVFVTHFNNEIVVADIFGEIFWLDQSLKKTKSAKISHEAITDLILWTPKRGPNSQSYWLVGTVSKKLLIKDEKWQDVESFEFGHAHSSLLSKIDTDGKYLALLTSRNRLYVFK